MLEATDDDVGFQLDCFLRSSLTPSFLYFDISWRLCQSDFESCLDTKAILITSANMLSTVISDKHQRIKHLWAVINSRFFYFRVKSKMKGILTTLWPVQKLDTIVVEGEACGLYFFHRCSQLRIGGYFDTYTWQIWTVAKNLLFCGVLAEVKTIDSYLYSQGGDSNAVQFRPIHYYDLLKQVSFSRQSNRQPFEHETYQTPCFNHYKMISETYI